MDGECRLRKPPPEVRREFIGCRLESQVLIRAYELAVPVVRRQVVAAWMPETDGAAAGSWNRAGLVAQGA
jgi:hypothetical protein